jgi:hypothetical protein
VALFDTPLPGDVLPVLEERGAGRARRWAERVAQTTVDGRETLAVLLDLTGLGAKTRFALSVLFPAPAFMGSRYGAAGPAALAFAYARRAGYFAVLAAKAVVLASLGALRAESGR